MLAAGRHPAGRPGLTFMMHQLKAFLLLLMWAGVWLTACGLDSEVAQLTPVEVTPSRPAETPTPAASLVVLTPTLTLTPTLVAPTVTSTPVIEPTAAPTAISTPVITPTLPIAEVENAHCVVGVEPDDVLNIRAQPGADQPIVGAIPPYGFNISVTGEGREVEGSMWLPITYGDLQGWVNSHYLAEQVGQADPDAMLTAFHILILLRDRDLTQLAELVHPERGVRFTPFGYIQETDRVFTADQLPDLLADPTVWEWGFHAGSGDPILLTFAEYYERFVYSHNFFQCETVGLNQRVSVGSSLDNSQTFFPGATVFDYHFDGFDPLYGGMDWRSLRLILEPWDGGWYLVGVINDEWTP